MDKEIIYKYFYGKATDDEEQEVLDWLDSNPEKHMAEMKQLHILDIAAQVYGSQSMHEKRRTTRFFRYFVTVAASVAVLLGAWFASELHTIHRLSKRIVMQEVPAGQRTNLVLEDGTRIALNSGSTLEYPAVFARGERRVKLSGEAIFEVKHDKDRPFIVETFASDIEVLGTRFSVDADEKHNRFSAMLLEGSVQIRSRVVPAQTITMQPNDRVDLIDGYLHKSQVSDFRELCWTEGIIHIRAMPFDELMRRLERAYNVNIIIERTTLPVIDVRSGKIRISEGIDYALHMLQRVSDFTYRYDEEQNQIVIR